MKFTGVIIEESLRDTSVLELLNIVATTVEPVTPEHKTPWLRQWTLHSFEISEELATSVAEKISSVLDGNDVGKDSWYADFKNDRTHLVIFRNKIFRVDRANPTEYEDVVRYGESVGIPAYQLDFASAIEETV